MIALDSPSPSDSLSEILHLSRGIVGEKKGTLTVKASLIVGVSKHAIPETVRTQVQSRVKVMNDARGSLRFICAWMIFFDGWTNQFTTTIEQLSCYLKDSRPPNLFRVMASI